MLVRVVLRSVTNRLAQLRLIRVRGWSREAPVARVVSRIGVGNGALGQVINLPQCGLTCPNATRGAREGAVRARRGLFSQRCLRFHSATTLCKRYNTCEVAASL